MKKRNKNKIKPSCKYFAFGKDEKEVFVIGQYPSKGKFIRELRNSGLMPECPMSKIITLNECSFQIWMITDGIKII